MFRSKHLDVLQIATLWTLKGPMTLTVLLQWASFLAITASRFASEPCNWKDLFSKPVGEEVAPRLSMHVPRFRRILGNYPSSS